MESQTTTSSTEIKATSNNDGSGEAKHYFTVQNQTVFENRLLLPVEEARAYEELVPGITKWAMARADKEQENRHQSNIAFTKNNQYYVAVHSANLKTVVIIVALCAITLLFALGRDIAGFTVTALSLIGGIGYYFRERKTNEKP